jgi:aminotransferase
LQGKGKKAQRLRNLKTSGIRRLFALTRHMPDVINLGIGEPDFSPPRHVLEAAIVAIRGGETHYTPSNGIESLRMAIVEKYSKKYGLTYDPADEVLVTVGATEAVSLGLLSLVNPGDEVLIPDPGFVCYRPAITIAGGSPISMPLREEDGFGVDINEAVTSLLTNKSRVMIVNSPSNPTGAVLGDSELSKIAKFAVENDLIVISDEVYEEILYDGASHNSLATFPGMRERTIVVNSFSKTYAMTGFRVGYAVGPRELISSMLLVHQFTLACVDGPAQYAATAALNGPQACVSQMVSEFDRRRKLMWKRLCEIDGFNCSLPRGAFYVFPDIRPFGKSSEAFTELLLEKARVVATPGEAFGQHGEGFIRFSYATSYEKIIEALDRIETCIKKLT